MEANVLTAAAKPARPGQPAEAQRVIQLVSNAPANKIVGLDGFLKAFNTKSVRAEVSPFRYVIQRRARRSMGGKFGKGLSQEVTENVEINPNEDLFGLRRWLGGIRQEPGCVMLLNVNKVREEALAAPLIFSEMLRTGRPILVTGAPPDVQDQLLSQIDLSFQQVPPAVLANTALKNSLAVRVQRRKGFVNTVRPVLELEGLPPALVTKLQAINAGQDSTLTEPELINVCLLADLATRYLPPIIQFREAMRNSSLQLPQLVSMFEILTSDMGLPQMLEAFKSYFTEEVQADPDKLKSRAAVFGEVYRAMSNRDSDKRGQGRQERMDEFFRKLASIVVRFRANVDTSLWRRCHFLGELDPGEQEVVNRLLPFHALLVKQVAAGAAAASPDFMAKMGDAVFDLVSTANKKPEELGGAAGMLKQAQAARLLPQFRLAKFAASSLVHISEANRPTLLNKDKFLTLFRKIPVALEELKELEPRLHAVLYINEHLADEVRRTTLDVMLEHSKEREKKLREIYILSAVPELVNYNFHMGHQVISPVERMSSFAICRNRLGLELRTDPADLQSIPLFELPDEPKLGPLGNDPLLVCRAYTALVGIQIERLVRRFVDHKINYLQTTFGENFFEVIYENVVERNDIPLSRNQLAWYVQRQGLLGNLQAKGWKPGEENQLDDDFILVETPALPGQKAVAPAKSFAEFPKRFATLSAQFTDLLKRLESEAELDPRDDNPAVLIWQLYKQGIYNLSRNDAKEVFRKSIFYNYLRDIITQISSENYSIFTREIQQEGIKIFVPRQYYFLLTLGSRFGFLVNDKVVRYQLVATPVETVQQLDTISRVFVEKIEERFNAPDQLPDVKALKAVGEEIRRCNQLWWDYSRHLAFALMDKVLTNTVIAQLQPGAIQPQNLWYLPDDIKLCLGGAATGSDLVPFQKLLQVPENMGNIQKNPKSSSTTIDDFTTEVHKIQRLKDELENLSSIAEDVLDILQNLTHSRAESPLVQKYEQNLAKLMEVLETPLRHFTEQEVQALHQTARTIKETLGAFYQTPGSTKDQLIGLLQNQLRARRSDGHLLKLNFTDTFVLETTEIKVMQKVKNQSGETVSRQKKMEVEVDATYQTIATRIRDVIHTHDLLGRKEHIVLQPEGQKKKQIEYCLDIINTLLTLRGNALTFYCDLTMLDEGQVQDLATRIKPHNFFKVDELKNEPPKGMAARAKDPLSGRLIANKAESKPAVPPGTPLPPPGPGESVEEMLAALDPKPAAPTPAAKPAAAPAPAPGKPAAPGPASAAAVPAATASAAAVPAAGVKPPAPVAQTPVAQAPVAKPAVAAPMLAAPKPAEPRLPEPKPPAAVAPAGSGAAAKPPVLAPPQAAPALPKAGEQIFASRMNPAVRYRYDPQAGTYVFLDASGPVPVRVVPVVLADGEQGAILMGKLPGGKFFCHGLYDANVLSPLPQKPEPPVLFNFAFPSNTVRVFNDGGKPGVRVDPV